MIVNLYHCWISALPPWSDILIALRWMENMCEPHFSVVKLLNSLKSFWRLLNHYFLWAQQVRIHMCVINKERLVLYPDLLLVLTLVLLVLLVIRHKTQWLCCVHSCWRNSSVIGIPDILSYSPIVGWYWLHFFVVSSYFYVSRVVHAFLLVKLLGHLLRDFQLLFGTLHIGRQQDFIHLRW